MKTDLKNILLAVIILIGTWILIYFIGRWTAPCTKDNVLIRIKDTVELIRLPSPITLKDTLWRKKIVYKYIEQQNDSLIQSLISQRDSIESKLKKYQIESIVSLDTIHSGTNDTIRITYHEFSKIMDIYWGLAPREVRIKKEVIYLDPPKREWWDNPYVSTGIGLLVGGTAGIIAGVEIAK